MNFSNEPQMYEQHQAAKPGQLFSKIKALTCSRAMIWQLRIPDNAGVEVFMAFRNKSRQLRSAASSGAAASSYLPRTSCKSWHSSSSMVDMSGSLWSSRSSTGSRAERTS